MKVLKAFIKPSEAPRRPNQLTGFYMRATLAHNGLMEIKLYDMFNSFTTEANCRAYQWSGFYVIGTFIMKELMMPTSKNRTVFAIRIFHHIRHITKPKIKRKLSNKNLLSPSLPLFVRRTPCKLLSNRCLWKFVYGLFFLRKHFIKVTNQEKSLPDRL